MSWTAITGKSVYIGDGRQQTQVFFTEQVSGKGFEDQLVHVGSVASLTAAVARRVDALDVQLKPPALIAVGTVIDLTPAPSAPKPTQAELDRQAFATAVYAELRQRTLAALSQATRDLMTDPTWVDDLPVML